MNKFLKIFVPILAGILIIAYFVCNLLIPGQTAWFMTQVGLVLNYPITIAGVSMTIGGIITYIIVNFVIKNSKFGRKELDNMKKEFEQLQDASIKHEQALTMKISEYEDKFNELKNSCNNQITIMLEQFEDLQNSTLDALKTIPNKKVQAIVAQYETEYSIKKQEIIEKTVSTNDYINEKIKKLEEMLNEAKKIFDSETEAA